MFEITHNLKKIKLFDIIIPFIIFLLVKPIRFFKKKIFNNDGSVVIIAVHKLGDSVFTIPAILEIVNNLNKQIIIVCNKDSVPIYNSVFQDVTYELVKETDFIFYKKMGSKELRKKLNNFHPEIVFDLTGILFSASLIFNSNAKLLIGMNRSYLKNVYDLFIPYTYEQHISEMYHNVVTLFLNNSPNGNFDIPLKINNIDNIYIQPFAGWIEKEWGLKKFIALADRIRNNFNISFIITHNSLTNDIIKEITALDINLIVTPSVTELINVLKDCFLLIGNDSGPVQIASLLGKATYSIYGPTNPIHHKPLGKHHQYISKQLKCSPKSNEKMCFTFGGRRGCPSNECLATLEVDYVYENLIKFIAEIKLNLNEVKPENIAN